MTRRLARKWSRGDEDFRIQRAVAKVAGRKLHFRGRVSSVPVVTAIWERKRGLEGPGLSSLNLR